MLGGTSTISADSPRDSISTPPQQHQPTLKQTKIVINKRPPPPRYLNNNNQSKYIHVNTIHPHINQTSSVPITAQFMAMQSKPSYDLSQPQPPNNIERDLNEDDHKVIENAHIMDDDLNLNNEQHAIRVDRSSAEYRAKRDQFYYPPPTTTNNNNNININNNASSGQSEISPPINKSINNKNNNNNPLPARGIPTTPSYPTPLSAPMHGIPSAPIDIPVTNDINNSNYVQPKRTNQITNMNYNQSAQRISRHNTPIIAANTFIHDHLKSAQSSQFIESQHHRKNLNKLKFNRKKWSDHGKKVLLNTTYVRLN